MDTERYNEAFGWFSGLIDQSSDEREARLAALANADPELADLVRSLLETDGNCTLEALNFAPPTSKDFVPPDEGARSRTSDFPRVDDFRITRLISAGSSASVYEAEQTRPKRRVVVKVFRGGTLSNRARSRFEDESEVLASLDHDGIARVLTAGETSDGRPFLVTEFIDGTTLNRYLKGQPIPLPERLRMVEQIADALSHAHSRLVLHRDVKPTNIVIARSDGPAVPKLIDFGISRRLLESEQPERTLASEILGTPQYMAPEQATIDGRDVDVRADVFALGAVLFFVLVGRTPFPRAEGETLLSYFGRLQTAPPPRLRRSIERDATAEERNHKPISANALSTDLEAIVNRALQPDRDDRYPTVAAFRDDLIALRLARPVSARKLTIRYEVGKLIERHKRRFLLGTVLVALAVGLIVVAGASAWHATQQRAAASAAQRQSILAAAAAAINGGRAGAAQAQLERLKLESDISAQIIAGFADASTLSLELSHRGLVGATSINAHDADMAVIGLDQSVRVGALDDPTSWRRIATLTQVPLAVASDVQESLFVALWGGGIVLIDAMSGVTIWEVNAGSDALALGVGPSGDALTVATSDRVIQIDTSTGEVQASVDMMETLAGTVSTACITAAGNVVLASEDRVVVTDAASQRKLGSHAFDDPIAAICPADVGALIQTRSGDVLHLDDSNETSNVSPLPIRGSDDERLVATDRETAVFAHRSGSLRVVRLDGTGHSVRLNGHADRVRAARILSQGEATFRLASASQDGSIRVWKRQHLYVELSRSRITGGGLIVSESETTGTLIRRWGHDAVVPLTVPWTDLAALGSEPAQRGTGVLIASGGSVDLLDTAVGPEPRWSVNVDLAATRAAGIVLVDRAAVVPSFTGYRCYDAEYGGLLSEGDFPAPVVSLAPFGTSQAIIGLANGEVLALNPLTGTASLIAEFEATPTALAATDRAVIVGTVDEQLHVVRNVESENARAPIAIGAVPTAIAAMVPDGSLLVGTANGTIAVVSERLGVVEVTLEVGTSPVIGLALAEDRSVLLVELANQQVIPIPLGR